MFYNGPSLHARLKIQQTLAISNETDDRHEKKQIN